MTDCLSLVYTVELAPMGRVVSLRGPTGRSLLCLLRLRVALPLSMRSGG
ncbi:hypothetical protein [Prochlorococcus sp. MIT 0702]